MNEIVLRILELLKTIFQFLLAIAAGCLQRVQNLFSPPPLPKLENTWWGPGQPVETDKSIKKFQIHVPDEDIKDLQWRLDHLRPLVPPLEGIQQQYGMNTNLLRDIVKYWKTNYDWRQREVFLNSLPQFKTTIQGLDIHYIHVKPTNVGNKKVLPLILLHGWPGSLREFYKVIPILTDPNRDENFVFEVIAPHIPGYGFSQAPAKPGCGAAQMAVIMMNLMNRLGFDKFYAQGGDFGAIILQHLSVLFPDSVLGYHTNMALVSTPLSYIKTWLAVLWPTWIVRPEHKDRVYPLKEKFEHRIRESGYLHLQATKPDTVGVGTTDSPAGLAAYILEKFTTGTNRTFQLREDGGLLEKFTYDDLLDNVMIYWWTGTATSSFRLYAETFSKAHMGLGITKHPIKVPTAVARFQYDFYTADGLLKEIYPNMVQLSDHEGGHFAAFEVPQVFADDVFSAVEKFQRFKHT